MKRQRIYVDTSVIGGCFDPEFAPWSNGLMRDFREGTFRPVVSDVVAAEVESAPANVKAKYGEMLDLGAEVVTEMEEARNLADSYQQHGILPEKFDSDCLHIALGTVAAVDMLVSWNFKHIVRFDKIRMFNAVNREAGYKELEIYSPREVTHYEER